MYIVKIAILYIKRLKRKFPEFPKEGPYTHFLKNPELSELLNFLNFQLKKGHGIGSQTDPNICLIQIKVIFVNYPVRLIFYIQDEKDNVSFKMIFDKNLSTKFE